jgi:hypothetical protein
MAGIAMAAMLHTEDKTAMSLGETASRTLSRKRNASPDQSPPSLNRFRCTEALGVQVISYFEPKAKLTD